jgi:hypothetical protein
MSQKYERLQFWYYRWEGFLMYTIEISHGMIYLLSFMKIDTGVEAILRLCLSNLNDCNVGIADQRDL